MKKNKRILIAEPDIGVLEKKYVNEALNTGWISSIGPMVGRFEDEFAKFVGVKYAIAVTSGTTALDLALIAADIGPGDEVIVPTLTFAATVNAVIHQKATPVLIDSALDDWNMDPVRLESLITPRTKAIIVVHLYGIPARMKEILKIAKKYKLFVIEDAAEAHGAIYGKKITGSIGDMGCFSFFANKIITTGEGGMVTTNNQGLYKKMKIIYSHGNIEPHGLIHYFHSVVGHNFQMTSLQAALGLAQLQRIRFFLKTRSLHEKLYRKFLKDVPGIKFSPKPKGVVTVDWMHSILVDHPKITRDHLMTGLKIKNIDTRPFFYPMHKMPPYLKYAKGEFPVAENLAATGINLPSSIYLKKEDISYICKTIRDIVLA